MRVYYNEYDNLAADWLCELIKEGLIPKGDVDRRSIEDVGAIDLKGYGQCHFFAGIGGWPAALSKAGIGPDRNVWTGSCPCQPFSSSGKNKGQSDERHLWPVWHRLISECRPATIFGEQVARAIPYGWLDEVKYDLESDGYAFAAAILPAGAVSKSHERERIWFVAHAQMPNDIGGHETISGKDGRSMWHEMSEPKNASSFCILEDEGVEWIEGIEGERLPIKPGLPLLVDGLPSKLVAICEKGFGNAIDPRIAVEFIKASWLS